MCFVFRVKEVCVEREYSFIIKLMSFTRARYFFLVVSVWSEKKILYHPREEKREEISSSFFIHHAHE